MGIINIGVLKKGVKNLRVHIEKSKKELLKDNLEILFKSAYGYVLGGAAVIGIILMIMGITAGYLAVTFAVVISTMRLIRILSALRVMGDKIETTYELDDEKLSIIHENGGFELPLDRILRIKDSAKIYTITMNEKSQGVDCIPLMRTGVVEGDIDQMVERIKEKRRETMHEKVENGYVEYSEPKVIEDEIDIDEMIATETQETPEERVSEEIEQEEILSETDEEVEEEIKTVESEISERAEEEVAKEELDKDIIEEDKEIIEIGADPAGEDIGLVVNSEETELTEIAEVKEEKKELVEIKSIVKFKNKFFNDVIRQYRIYFSRVTTILALFLAFVSGTMSIYFKNYWPGGVLILMGVLMCVAPIIDIYRISSNRKGIISIGLDSHNYLVIDNGTYVNKIHKDKVAVGKAKNGEVIVSLFSAKNAPFSIRKNEIIEGDVYELFKVLQVGDVKEFNLMGVISLAFTAVAYAQIPMVLIWQEMGNAGAGLVIIILSLITSIVLAVFAMKKKGSMMKQASWAVILDVLFVIIMAIMYFMK